MLQESARDLCELLEQATSLAGRLGDVPAALPVDERPSFLVAQADNDPQPIIERIAAAERLTFVVGAGASMEAGLPSWASLVRDVLAAVAPADLADGDRAAWLSAVEESGLLGMAATARALAGSDADFMKLVDHHVYRGKGAEHFDPVRWHARSRCGSRAIPRSRSRHSTTTNCWSTPSRISAWPLRRWRTASRSRTVSPSCGTSTGS